MADERHERASGSQTIRSGSSDGSWRPEKSWAYWRGGLEGPADQPVWTAHVGNSAQAALA